MTDTQKKIAIIIGVDLNNSFSPPTKSPADVKVLSYRTVEEILEMINEDRSEGWEEGLDMWTEYRRATPLEELYAKQETL